MRQLDPLEGAAACNGPLVIEIGGLLGGLVIGSCVIVGSDVMIERKERKPYWRHTKWQMLSSLLPFLLILIIFPFYADRLNSNKLLGFPLGYFLVCHGLILIANVTVFVFVNRQDALDHWHGAHEDM